MGGEFEKERTEVKYAQDRGKYLGIHILKKNNTRYHHPRDMKPTRKQQF